MGVTFQEGILKTSLEGLVDEALALANEINAIEKDPVLVQKREKLTALKQKIEREMEGANIMSVEGKDGKATWVNQERSKVNVQKLMADCGLDADDIKNATDVTNIKFIKITPARK